MAMTRRKLLSAMARLGGAAAVYETLAAWDFLKAPPAMNTWSRLNSAAMMHPRASCGMVQPPRSHEP